MILRFPDPASPRLRWIRQKKIRSLVAQEGPADSEQVYVGVITVIQIWFSAPFFVHRPFLFFASLCHWLIPWPVMCSFQSGAKSGVQMSPESGPGAQKNTDLGTGFWRKTGPEIGSQI